MRRQSNSGTEENSPDTLDTASRFVVHVLDMGTTKYGDSLVCQIGNTRILIDGGHPGDDRLGERSLQRQLAKVLQGNPPFHFDLLVITHCHVDHIGCLPALAERGFLQADWVLAADPDLGWGKDPAPDGPVGALTALLREDGPIPFTSEAEIWRYALDALDMQGRYRQMLDQLERVGGRVVRFGNPADSAALEALKAEFAERAGMSILGPTQAHLVRCAEYIGQRGRDMQDRLQQRDAAATSTSLLQQYRTQLTASDAPGVGAALNDQSIVLLFDYAGKKALLAGDMQFEESEVPGLDSSMRTLRQRVGDTGPFDLYKIGHHASYNAFGYETLATLGETSLFVISTGRTAGAHPSARSLNVLNAHRNSVKWYRNDRNGIVSVQLAPVLNVVTEQGMVNDGTPNPRSDILPEPPRTQEPILPPEVIPATPTLAPSLPTPLTADTVEVVARIPHVATRVTLTVTVEPGGSASVHSSPLGAASPAPVETISSPAASDAIRLAGGRTLPPLLFVTHQRKLAARIGEGAAAAAVQAIRDAGQKLLDLESANPTTAAAAAAVVRPALTEEIKGVVLLGGHSVVPLQRLDAIPAPLRAQLPGNMGDPDDFLVWSDDVYGDKDGRLGVLELPVSRIPDGGSAQLVRTALEAGGTRPAPALRGGVRNIARPFADRIFADLPGTASMHISAPRDFQTIEQQSPSPFAAERLYLMLHGDWQQPDQFVGEGVSNPAVRLQGLPATTAAVVFTGCCWGALVVDQPARFATGTPGEHTANTALCLRFLQNGSLAFIGNTGVHYSPGPAADIFGGPMHRLFWYHYGTGCAPAEALFLAKRDYALGIPHRPGDPGVEAIEQKILRQYTCLVPCCVSLYGYVYS